jgi:hypothetical protein
MHLLRQGLSNLEAASIEQLRCFLKQAYKEHHDVLCCKLQNGFSLNRTCPCPRPSNISWCRMMAQRNLATVRAWQASCDFLSL